MKKRRSNLLLLMKERGVDAALITRPENMRYLTGYTGEGAVYLDAKRAVILTDFRYVEQASKQAPELECMRTTADIKMPALAAELLGNEKRLAVETGYMTVDQYRDLEAAVGSLCGLDTLVERLRMVKEPCEQDMILRASEIACDAFLKLLGIIRPGMTEREVQFELEGLILRGGSEQVAFPTIICSGLNGSQPHAVPGDHKLEKGELLTLDFGAQVSGYKTDMTRTVAIGDISAQLRDIYHTVLEAQARALELIRPGVNCRDVDAAAREVIDPKYPGAFGHGLGHGVGLEIHEAPGFSVRSDAVLEPGHVMTVEPGIYIPGVGGCRIEDTIIVSHDGYVNAITAPKELIVL